MVRDVGKLQIELEPHADGGQGVVHAVAPGHAQPHVTQPPAAEGHLEAGVEPFISTALATRSAWLAMP